MNNSKLILILGILLVLLSVMVIILKPRISGEVIRNNELNYTHIYTKAICDSNNLCQDYEIICKNTTLIEKKPITGAIVQHLENWKDPRGENSKNNFCDLG